MASLLGTALPALVNRYAELQQEREARAEKIRQFEETKKLQMAQLEELKRQREMQYGEVPISQVEQTLGIFGIKLPELYKETGRFVPGKEKFPLPISMTTEEVPPPEIPISVPERVRDIEAEKARSQMKIRAGLAEKIPGIIQSMVKPSTEWETYVQAKKIPQDLRTPLQQSVVKKREEPTPTYQPITPELAAWKYAGVPVDEVTGRPLRWPTKKELEAASDYLAGRAEKRTEETTKARIRAMATMTEDLKRIRITEELAKFDPQVLQGVYERARATNKATLQVAQEKAQLSQKGQMLAGLERIAPDGPTLNELVETSRNLGRPIPSEITQQLHLYRSTMDAVNRMRTQFTEEEVWNFAGIYNRALGYARITGKALWESDEAKLQQYLANAARGNEKFFKFLVANEQLRATAFQYGGKQLTPFEASVVFGFTPTGRELFGEYYMEKIGGLEQFTLERLNQLERLVRTPRGSLGVTPLPPPVSGWPSTQQQRAPLGTTTPAPPVQGAMPGQKSPPATMPIPFSSLPEKARRRFLELRGKDGDEVDYGGKVYIKQGDMLVPPPVK